MPCNARLRVSKVLIALAVAVPLVAVSDAQQRDLIAEQQVQQRGGLNPDSFYGKETFQGVSVRDSLEAVKKIEDARRMERLEDWNKAADWYQEVIEKYGQYVIPSGLDADKRQNQYKGIEGPVQEQLAKWPKAGLDAYRNRYGPVAANLLAQAKQGDKETLSRVMKLYFVSDAGRDAGIKLVDLLLEDGDFAEAARVGDRLLDWHPNLIVERPKILFRTALALHLSGNQTKAKQRFEQLKRKYSGSVGTLFGKDIVLADALERLLQVAPPVSVATQSGSVRLNPGGNESRSMISAATGRPGARQGMIELAPTPKLNAPNLPGQNFPGQQQLRPDRDASSLGIFPVADDGELYFQDGSRVYAVSVQSGVPLPGWTQTYPGTNGQYTVNNYAPARNQQFTLTLTDNSVLGVLGYSERWANFGMPVYGSDRGTRLVCLDRQTGKEKWVARPGKISEENLRALDFSGSPLVVGDNVYVIGRGGKNMASEDCYVLCFNVNTGAYKWNCFIASANNVVGYNMQMPANDTLSHLAYSSGRIYVLTNLGAAAALDAYSGTISWLNIYPRDNSLLGQEGIGFRNFQSVRGGNTTKAWEFNPVIVQDGRVFIMPTDAKHLLVYDAGTGAELKRLSTTEIKDHVSEVKNNESSVPEAILAVDKNEVFLTGGASVYCVDWTQPEDKCIKWHCAFAHDVAGRGFVTSDSVFVCCESGNEENKYGQGGLWRIDRSTGMRKESYPAKKDWDENEGPGNVLVIGDQVIVAGAKRVNIYADMTLVRNRLDADVAAAPLDPEPRLRYAEVMFVAGRLDVAMEKLNETVKLLGGLKSMRSGPERDHLFNDCLTFATKLQKDKKSETIESIAQLYDLAASSADGESQQVNYRMSRAKFDRDFVEDGSLEAAVKLYQEILASQHLRSVPLTDDEAGGATQASQVAEKMIDEVKKVKPEAYEVFEKESSDALQAAGNDPALLKSVADTYPNSTAASKAMITAADAFEAQGNQRLAAYTRRQAYNKYGDTADKPRLLEGMARNYLAMPDRTADRIDTAAARLSTIVKLGSADAKLAKPLKLPGDKVLAEAGVSVADALAALQNYKAKSVAARLPDFHIFQSANSAYQKEMAAWKASGAEPGTMPKRPPSFIPADKQLVLSDIDALVKPPADLAQQYARHDRVVAWSNGGLLLFPVGAKEPLGRSTDLAGPPKNLLWLDDNASLLVWNDAELTLLSGDDAKAKWKKLTLKNLPKIEVVSGGSNDEIVSENNNEQMPGQVMINGRIIRGGRVFNGRFIQPVQMPAVPQAAPAAPGVEAISAVRPVDDKIIVSTTGGQLFAIRTADGTVAWQTRLSASAPISRLAATDDFVVAKVDDVASTQLVIVETLTGQFIHRLSFANESGNVPVNFALAPDGTLVWIQQDRLCGKDLFEPKKKELNYEIVAGQNDVNRQPNINFNRQPMDGSSAIYSGAVGPDQLLISEGRILVVTHQGRYVSVYSLESGKLLDYTQPDGRKAEARFTTSGQTGQMVNDWSATMHLVGSKLYIFTRINGPMCYNLDQLGLGWDGAIDTNTTPNVQIHEPFIGQDHLVLLDRIAVRPGANPNPNRVRLHCYSRATDAAGHETGRIDDFPYIRDDSGISEFQGVNGGFYYLTGDKKLHYLQGSVP